MTTYSSESLHDDLVKNGHIIPVGVQGIFGRGKIFEDVLRRFEELVTRLASNDGAEWMMFPPVISRKVFEKSEFLDSFPQLAGAVFSFYGNDAQHAELRDLIRSKKNWDHLQKMTDVALAPSACYPVYPSFTGTLPKGGRLVDVQNWVFRHEPSPEPTRLQAFRMREFVRTGTGDEVVEWRDKWHERGLALLMGLGLPAKSDVANDPFFGRGGRMLAANQRDQKLKFEVLVPVISEEKPTACCSFNYHHEHFGQIFDIKTEDGATAQTACLGFGMERVTMALFRTHGMDPGLWPKAVRDQLWP